ncbi:MAG: GTPase Era [Gammaproteobacteria bacterium]|nr:GTPase Era [Gammaproteobacteria bacterium]
MSSIPTLPHTGHIAIVGRPNVGKSTLLNSILGQKLAISSSKPQTTRHQILGVKTEGNIQAIYVDTPGLHLNGETALNRYMNRVAKSALFDVDVLVWVVDRDIFNRHDEWVLSQIKETTCPVILVINKIDQIKDKKALLPLLDHYQKMHSFTAIVPISAKTQSGVQALEKEIHRHLPEGPFQFEEDALTDRSLRFLAAEIIREKLMRQLGQEIPYSLTVEIEQFDESKSPLEISAVIYLDKASQKPIVIGAGGEKLKIIGRDARLEINRLLGRRCHLQLWIKIKSGWADDDRALKSLGYDF